MKKPIFILGVGRTGSQMLMNVLNNHHNIFIDREINFLFRFKKCIVTEIKSIGDLKQDENAEKAIELLYSGRIKKDFQIMEPVPKNDFKELFLNSDRSLKGLFSLIIETKAKLLNKTYIGAKFPVHFSYISLLTKWFPDCKIIYLTRDPRAILASELEMKKRDTYASQFPIKKGNIFFKFSVLLYVTVQWVWAQRVYVKYKKRKDIYLSKYENLVSEPNIYVKEICDYLEVSYETKMLDIQIQDSSFKKENFKGFNKSTIEKWKTKLTTFEKIFISFFTLRQRKKIGY